MKAVSELRSTMALPHGIFLLLITVSTAVAQGPVFGGGSSKPQANPKVENGQYLTQTVYGFLDFTTTIGNTVMVFSPNSAPPVNEPSTTAKPEVSVIETKPVISKIEEKVIKPSKTQIKEKESNNLNTVTSKSVIENVKENNKQTTAKVSNKSPLKETKIVINKVESESSQNNKPNIKPNSNKPLIISSKVEIKQVTETQLKSVITKIGDDVEEPAVLVPNNNIGEPEYDFLSRQPSEFIEETYKVINIRPSKLSNHKSKPKLKTQIPVQLPIEEDDEHPLGIVTTLGGTVVKDGMTTIHETNVIGTIINGKYAQVLHSTSRIHSPSYKKISPSPTQKITKTSAPSLHKNHRHSLDPTPAASVNEESIVPHENSFSKTSRRPSGGNSFKNRQRPSNNDEERKNKNKNTTPQQKTYTNRYRASNTPELATVSVFSESATQSYSSRRKNNRNNSAHKSSNPVTPNDSHSRRGFKPRVTASPVEPVTSAASTSVYKFKLNRTPGRWQYKTSPKPKVTIRKMNGDDEGNTTPISSSQEEDQSNDVSLLQSRSDNDLELSGSQSGPGSLYDSDGEDNSIEKSPPLETIKVEISTPADFKDVYYEIATIKSPYTFQVGRVKNTRIITVTSTIPRSIEPLTATNIVQNIDTEPLTENILATVSPYNKDHNPLEPSIVTLPPIVLPSDMETPPLETLTDTFSTTQDMLKTHILPVISGNDTTSYTFIQTYHITRLVTATKTLPPMEYYQFIPSKTLKEFNSRLDEAGSELHLELEFGDDNEEEDGQPKRAYLNDLDLEHLGSNFDLSEVDKYRLPDNHLRLKKAHGQNNPKAQQITEAPPPTTPALTPEQAQQLALLRLLNPAAAAQIPNVVTTSKPILKYETVYESHVIPVFDGKATVQSTISRPVSTITKTEYEIGTSTLPALPIPQLNPLFPQQQFITSTPVVKQTEIVSTDSQILKLTFGAKTVFTTLYSTRVVPTVLTTYVTQSLPVQPTAAFPGYFPSPFAPYPYVG